MLPEPGRLSTTMVCLSARDRRSVTKRHTMSGAEPAGNETMTLIGFAGQVCALAGQVAASVAIARSGCRGGPPNFSPPPPAHPHGRELRPHRLSEELRRAQRFLH